MPEELVGQVHLAEMAETVVLEAAGLQVVMAAMVVQEAKEEMAGTEATAGMAVTDKMLSPGPVGR
ncbi:hypothetical protein [Pseudomonas sp.]|uniref:hypothetical protein n=1 Tax=Pseudomonas sp. TaxID=306 RepID=UPI003267176E